MDIKGKYNFIRLKKVIIRNFSLYSRNNSIQTVDENINSGVYCLAGANGLGKTTFLNIINYGLTGLVLEPNKEVYSPSEIIKSNKKYTERYFEGRINAKDKENAEVEIRFEVNSKNYKLIRGFSERDSLRKLEIYEIKNNKVIPFIS